MKIISKLFFLSFLTGVAVIITSCKKFVDIEPAPGLISTAAIFTDDRTAISASNGIYTEFRGTTSDFTDSGLSIYASLSADEIENLFSNSNYDAFRLNSVTPSEYIVNECFWSRGYKSLYSINAIIDGLDKSLMVSDPVKKQVQGEMKFLRGWIYFHLVNLFGDVPIITGTDYRSNASEPRTSINLVYEQITNDLKDAISLLSENYPTPGKTKPNKWTAAAMLSRVYLYQQNWPGAEEVASSVIASSQYTLTDAATAFNINSPETIWELATPNDAGNTTQALTFLPYSPDAVPEFSFTQTFIAGFEQNDLRKELWVGHSLVNGADYYYPSKYNVSFFASPVQQYNIVFRLAEQYLIRAESRLKQGDIDGCKEDIKVIRDRANLPAVVTIVPEELTSILEQERRSELFTEWGHRWFDLKRTGRLKAIIEAAKGGVWNPDHELFPIPAEQLLYNPYLTQNKGY